MKSKLTSRFGGIAVAGGLAAAVLLGGVAPAHAAAVGINGTVPIASTEAVSAPSAAGSLEQTKDISALVSAVTRDAAGHAIGFDGVAALQRGASRTSIDEFATGLAIGGVPSTGATVDNEQVFKFSARSRSACGGTNGVNAQWWGVEVKLNSCTSTQVAGLATSGAGVSAIAGAVTAATGVGVIATPILEAFAGYLAISGGLVSANNDRNQGVVLHYLYVSALPWVTPQ